MTDLVMGAGRAFSFRVAPLQHRPRSCSARWPLKEVSMSRSGVSTLAWSAAFVIALGSIGCGAGADGSSPGMEERTVGTVESEILAGTKTSQKEVVSVVLAITETGEPGFICSGVLMHNRAVITAAHCLDEYRAHKGEFILQVRTGSNAFSPDAKANIRDKRISSVIPCPGANTGGWAIHPNYDPNDFTNGYDFAVVVLDKALVDVKANIEWTIPPLTLPGTFDINPDGYFGRR